MPGDAMFPGSTIFSVTIPSNGRSNRGEGFGRARLVAGGMGALDGRLRLQRSCGGTGDPRFGTPQRRGGVIELLRRGGPLGLEAGDAIVRRACESQPSLRGFELGVGRLRPLFGGQGR